MASDPKRAEAIRKIFQQARFPRHVGLVLEELGDGHARLSLECREELRQIHGVMHGGALATLADTAVAFALATLLTDDQHTATIEMKINYLLPIYRGKATAEARIIKKGQRTAVGEVDIFNDEGQLAGKSLMTYMILQK